jgi:large subunit ribosomal protein L23
MNAHDVIIKPLLTEKAYDSIATKKYGFIVCPDATKTDVKKAVEQIFEVKVAKVNTVNVSGKFKRERGKEGYTSKYKKAYVQLTAKSKTIKFFENLG